MVLQWLGQNLIRGWNHKRCPHGWAGGVFYEDLEENWPCYNGTTLYVELCYNETLLNLVKKSLHLWQVSSLAPGGFEFNFRKVIFKLTLVNGGWGISYEIALKWVPLDLTDDKSTLVQVMAWCHQATSHYLSQCWPRFVSSNGATRPQWDNMFLEVSPSQPFANTK